MFYQIDREELVRAVAACIDYQAMLAFNRALLKKEPQDLEYREELRGIIDFCRGELNQKIKLVRANLPVRFAQLQKLLRKITTQFSSNYKVEVLGYSYATMLMERSLRSRPRPLAKLSPLKEDQISLQFRLGKREEFKCLVIQGCLEDGLSAEQAEWGLVQIDMFWSEFFDQVETFIGRI